MLQKVKQQILDNIVLIIVLTAGAIGSFKSVQVNVRLKDLTELQTRLTQLENTCTELMHVQDDLEDLRIELGKHLAGHPSKKK